MNLDHQVKSWIFKSMCAATTGSPLPDIFKRYFLIKTHTQIYSFYCLKPKNTVFIMLFFLYQNIKPGSRNSPLLGLEDPPSKSENCTGFNETFSCYNTR